MSSTPKLSAAIAQIQKILKENDLSGIIMLHEPGYCEYRVEISPSYSCAKLVEEGDEINVLFEMKKEHYTDEDLRQAKIRDTSNMFVMLAECATNVTMGLITVSDEYDKVIGAEHTKTERS